VSSRQRVAVVTGGGGGIGAAIAEELGRDGWFVVTVDPLVTLDGSERLQEPEETTAGRIVAAGGSARASSVSVTDGEAVRGLFNELVEEQGGLDAVVNVAGITRQTGFAHGAEQDWLAVLAVHLGGYLNVLDAALPLRVGVASRRCRRLQLRQASRRRHHLADRPAGATGGDRQRHVAHRCHPNGRRCHRTCSSGGHSEKRPRVLPVRIDAGPGAPWAARCAHRR